MTKARIEDRHLIIDILSQAFLDNQSVNYIIRQDEKKLERIRALIGYSVEVCSLFGEVLLSLDKKACALILYPHLKRTTLKSILLDIQLIFRVIGLSGIGKVVKREALIKEKQPKEPMAYLWFIGVSPISQYTGIGSGLLREVLAEAERKGLPVYLETSTEKNLLWYEGFGFRVYR